MLTGVSGAPVTALVAASVVWNLNVTGSALMGAGAQPVAGSGPGLMIVAKTVAGVPTWTDRLAGRMAAAREGPELSNRNARTWPLCRPTPTMSPASLIADALVRTHPEPAGSSVLRSRMT